MRPRAVRSTDQAACAGLPGRLAPAASVHGVGYRLAPTAQVARWLLAVANGDRPDRGELRRHPERLAEGIDPVHGDAEETSPQPSVYGSQQRRAQIWMIVRGCRLVLPMCGSPDPGFHRCCAGQLAP